MLSLNGKEAGVDNFACEKLIKKETGIYRIPPGVRIDES